MTNVSLVAAALLVAGTGDAVAAIDVTRAEYNGGVLVIEGRTPYANQFVALDGRYRKRTGRYGKFVFRVRYLPKNCTAVLTAGSQKNVVKIANCEPIGR